MSVNKCESCGTDFEDAKNQEHSEHVLFSISIPIGWRLFTLEPIVYSEIVCQKCTTRRMLKLFIFDIVVVIICIWLGWIR